ncbi:MAG: DUF6599 family protein [Cyclonatronaceae bacterium]
MMKTTGKRAAWPILAVLMLGTTAMAGASGADFTEADRHRKLFPALEGWESPQNIDVYDWDNIWDIINGAAELYYAYDFQAMYWGRYDNSDDEDTYIVMEIYRQGSPLMAFGVYSQERPRPPQLVDVGVEGFAAPGALHFFVSDLYVRMRSHDTSEETAAAMHKLASKVAENVDPEPEYPAIVHKLPEEGRVDFSEEYIHTNFLGHPFLPGAFVSTYEVDGTRFKLFVMELEDGNECQKMLADYYQFSGQEPDEITSGIHRIEDRWNGEVGILWKGHMIYGYYNLEDNELQEQYLQMFSH